MKKFIFAFVAAVAIVFVAACTSCSDDTKFGIEYSLTSDGQAQGDVTLNFDSGHFTLNGEADYQLCWSNQLIVLDETTPVALKNALEAKDDPKLVETAQKVDRWITDNIYISDASGIYDIYVKGYVKETATQITFTIDRHFTNKEEPSE